MTAEVVSQPEGNATDGEKNKFELLSVLVEKVSGTVKWFSINRHYGFIQRDDNKEDVFVHRTAITASRSRYPTLKNGEPVEFSVVETTGGVNAASVTGPGGQNVKGVYFFRRRPKPHHDSGVGNGADEVNGTAASTNGGGDVEGTRQRGGPRYRRFRNGPGRRSKRPSQNGMGDGHASGAEGSGAVGEEGTGEEGAGSPTEGGAPRQRSGGPRRGGGRGFGGNRRRNRSHKSTSEAGGEAAAAAAGTTAGEGAGAEGAGGEGTDRPAGRRGGRFRRGGGGGRSGRRNGPRRQPSGTAEGGDHQDDHLEQQMKKLDLNKDGDSSEVKGNGETKHGGSADSQKDSSQKPAPADAPATTAADGEN